MGRRENICFLALAFVVFALTVLYVTPASAQEVDLGLDDVGDVGGDPGPSKPPRVTGPGRTPSARNPCKPWEIVLPPAEEGGKPTCKNREEYEKEKFEAQKKELEASAKKKAEEEAKKEAESTYFWWFTAVSIAVPVLIVAFVIFFLVFIWPTRKRSIENAGLVRTVRDLARKNMARLDHIKAPDVNPPPIVTTPPPQPAQPLPPGPPMGPPAGPPMGGMPMGGPPPGYPPAGFPPPGAPGGPPVPPAGP